jgi:hypothetical protein
MPGVGLVPKLGQCANCVLQPCQEPTVRTGANDVTWRSACTRRHFWSVTNNVTRILRPGGRAAKPCLERQLILTLQKAKLRRRVTNLARQYGVKCNRVFVVLKIGTETFRQGKV